MWMTRCPWCMMTRLDLAWTPWSLRSRGGVPGELEVTVRDDLEVTIVVLFLEVLVLDVSEVKILVLELELMEGTIALERRLRRG